MTKPTYAQTAGKKLDFGSGRAEVVLPRTNATPVFGFIVNIDLNPR